MPPSHLHNMLIGHSVAVQKLMTHVLKSPSATAQAKAIAADIAHNATLLQAALKERVK